MIYTFKCESGHRIEVQASIKEGPPKGVCPCGKELQRDWQADEPTIDTSSCRDHNFIPREKRVFKNGSRKDADKLERVYAENVKRERALLKGGNKGTIKKKMAVPAELYHGKIRETGDNNYWKDPKNVSRHSEFKVD